MSTFTLTFVIFCARIVAKYFVFEVIMNPFLVAVIIAVSVLFVFFLVFLFLIKPNCKRREEMKKFASVKYAHRGLHNAERAENSMSAFAAATDAGYGIELDVRLTKDGELVVFHDTTLDRVTEGKGRVDLKTLAELRELHLSGTADTVPTFGEVLSLVGGRVPLLVEIKEETTKCSVTEKTLELLADYKGDVVIESFNPAALKMVKERAPHLLRGILSQNFFEEKNHRTPLYFLLQILLLNVICRPDFVSFNHLHYKNAALRLVRRLFRTPTVAWTVKTEEEARAAISHGFDGVIFENFSA